MKSYTDLQLVKIFKAAERTLFEETSLVKNDLSDFKKINSTGWDDNHFFRQMVSVAFYSGFRAATVTAKIHEIEKIFSSYEKVAKFDEEKIQSIIDSKKVIGNRLKIQGIVYNAKQIKQIKKEFGSFNTYLDSFGDRNDDDVLFNSIVPALKKRFKYLAKITVFHFLMDLGFKVLKPDIVLSRIFLRLGLVDSKDDNSGVIKAGRNIAAATKEPIRYIDIIFVQYGQVGENGICLEKNPKCNICHMYDFCTYKQKKKN